jgi:hypothetical protein
MNRDIIHPGKTYGKFAETFALMGGVGAILYPFVFYYVGYTAIIHRDDYLYCVLK